MQPTRGLCNRFHGSIESAKRLSAHKDPFLTFELMTVGLIGLLTTISVFVGAYLGLYYSIPEKLLSSILAFAAGSLIAALAIELSF